MNKFFKLAFLLFAGIAGVFYLLILPPLVATGTMEISVLSIGFAAFMIFQLWMLVAEFAYESASAVFDFKRKKLFKFLDLHRYEKKEVIKPSGFSVLLSAFLSYLLMIYGYGVIYMFISTTSLDAFSVGKLGVIDGVYFSLVNSSTVGFGDITPKSATAKLVVMSQIIMNMAYIVMLFSSAVSYARDETSNSNKPNHTDLT
jgi:hypothetical protein